jgi:hypothetical protein
MTRDVSNRSFLPRNKLIPPSRNTEKIAQNLEFKAVVHPNVLSIFEIMTMATWQKFLFKFFDNLKITNFDKR